MKNILQKSVLVGIGNAGVSVLDRIAVEHPSIKETLVINTDGDSLSASVTARRIAFPPCQEGDLSEGFLAVEEEFIAAIHGAPAVILCGALGGELGSFLIPALAARAKADGITTLASVAVPFSFEGRQKREIAAAALRKLHDLCDGVAVIENDRLAGGVPSTAAVGEAFVAADRALQSSLLALRGMLSTSGPVKITRADLAGSLGIPGAMTHFGYGMAKGANRLHEALEEMLRSPLLTIAGKGSALKEAATVLLLLRGPSDLSFAEVQRAVVEIERVAGERCLVKVGVLADGSPDDPLEIYLLAGSGGSSRKTTTPATQVTHSSSKSAEELPPVKPQATLGEAREAKSKKSSAAQQTQGVLNLETYQRGRFDKSEPTIVEGEDLDIPTFLRKGIKLISPFRH
jgi:cell division protein FtsZ